MNTREIVSLQFGHYSNFIGTHWWNLQETGFNYVANSPSEINHDVLFREGVTHKGEVTFTPRLLLVDLKGSLRTLPERGDLYETVAEPATASVPWPEHAVQIIAEEKPAKNDFQEALAAPNTARPARVTSDGLDGGVTVWSDYLYSRLHPRSVHLVREYQHSGDGAPFDVYPLGTALWQRPAFVDEFSDKVRSYIEECDRPQGFHVTVDAVNAFGGLATACLEHLKDEYDRKSVLAFAAIPSCHADYGFSSAEGREQATHRDSLRLLNLALSLDGLREHGDLTVPLCTGSKGWRQPGPPRHFSNVVYKPELPYHSSAILAAALDTVTLPYRTRAAAFTVADFCASLSTHGRKVTAASLALPLGVRPGEDLIDCLDRWCEPPWQSVTPNCAVGTDNLVQSVAARGISASRLKRSPQRATRQRAMAAYRCDSVQEMVRFYCECTSIASASHVTAVAEPLSTKAPYPNIFDEYVTAYGSVQACPRTADQGLEVSNVPVLAACQTGPNVGTMLETLHREAGRLKLARFHQFRSAGLEQDDLKESLTRLLDLRECYDGSLE